ncbi:MAG: gliding motility-associated C-terminal domain-containing protein [Chitinophagales bacterium]|nr:gliding motility-associated C-terminal domain-containing protein [Chitinophagales bacterium]
MPNAFTPNGDNVNDRIYPIFNNANVRVTDFRIYNSWGQMVSNDVEQGWDGNFNGSEQPNGTFTYFISYERTNTQTGKSETIRKDGTLTLVR